MKDFFARSVALIVLLASPAIAADLAVKAPAPVTVAPVNDWSGFYLGAYAGYGWGHDPFQETLVDQPALGVGGVGNSIPFPGPTISGVNSRGWLAGGYAGYNWQYRQWVGGLEIDLSGTGIKGSNSNTVSASIFVPGLATFAGTNTASVSDKFDLLGSTRARLGFLAWPNLLLYGTGGLGWTRFVQTFSDTVITTHCCGPGTIIDSSSTTNVSTPSWRFGWVAGLGGEARMFDSNWFVRVEYLHYDFGNSGSSQQPVTVGVAPTASNAVTSFTSGHLTADVVRGGIAYKF